jgi:putative flippase GtrA
LTALEAAARATAVASLSSILSPRVLRFIVVGFSGVFVNLGSLWFLADFLELNEELGVAISIEISIVWNFFINNAWTFQDRNLEAQSNFSARLVRYNLVSLVGLGIQWGSFVGIKAGLISYLAIDELGLWKYIAVLPGIGVATIWNFLSNFYWTWAQTSSPNESERE